MIGDNWTQWNMLYRRDWDIDDIMVGDNVHHGFKRKIALEMIKYIQMNVVLEKQTPFIRPLAGQACASPTMYASFLGTSIHPNWARSWIIDFEAIG